MQGHNPQLCESLTMLLCESYMQIIVKIQTLPSRAQYIMYKHAHMQKRTNVYKHKRIIGKRGSINRNKKNNSVRIINSNNIIVSFNANEVLKLAKYHIQISNGWSVTTHRCQQAKGTVLNHVYSNPLIGPDHHGRELRIGRTRPRTVPLDATA